ncbi:MAG: TonB-dependent receptor [Rikenellaceae bacterium]
MSILRSIVLTSLALIVSAIHCRGQEVTTIDLDSVVIYGSRPLRDVALTKTDIDSTALAVASSESLAELISRSTTAFIKSYGGGAIATIALRGTGASHTQVEWNGININNPMLGQVDFSLIPVSFIDKAELFMGGSSLSEGSGSLGGTVVIGSKPKWNDNFYGSLTQNVGSYGLYNTFVEVGGGGRRLQARVRYLYEQADNDFKFRNIAIAPFEIVKQKNAFYRKNGVQADLFFRASQTDVISMHGWFHSADRELPTIMSYDGLGREESQDDRESRIVAKWSRYKKRYKSNLTSGVTFSSIDYVLQNRTNMGMVTNQQSESRVFSLYNKHQGEYSFTEKTMLKTTANLDYHAVESNDVIKGEGYDKRRVQAGLGVSLHHAFNNTFSGYLLVREEYIEDKFSPLMPSLGVDVALLKDKNLHFKVNATRNYHFPTLNDLYWVPGGNPKLRPEKGYTADFTGEYRYAKGVFDGSLTATAYISKIDDWIIWRPSEYQYWSAENIKEVLSQGFELNARGTLTLDAWKITISASYAYTKSTNKDAMQQGDNSVGKQLIYVPLNKGGILGTVSFKGFYINYDWGYVSERYTTSSNEDNRHYLPAYSLHNADLGKVINFNKDYSLEVSLRMNNIFNLDYQAILYRAMPGRNFLGTLKFRF